MLKRLSGHEIVCGYGRMGRAVVEELRRAGHSVVVGRAEHRAGPPITGEGILAIAGDGTSESVLREADIANAREFVPCLNDDAHNVYTVLTARSLNSKLFIVARATEKGAEQRILHTGADRVVNPYDLGGTRLAHLVVKLAIVSFVDASLEGTDWLFDQTSLHADGPVVDSTLPEMKLRQ